MEIWEEIYRGLIPKGVYQIQLQNGEQQGLTIELSSKQAKVMMNFGVIKAMRMLDEGIVQTNLFSDNEIKKYRENHFRNVIYELVGGKFSEEINKMSSGYGDALGLKHYLVITENYIVEIVTEWEPSIQVHPVD